MRPARPGPARSRLLIRVIAALVCAAASTGCLSGSVDVTVRDDGSGVVVVEVFPDSELQRQVEALDVESLLAAPAGSTDMEVSRVERGGRQGYRVELPFDDAAAIGAGLTSGLVVGGQEVTLFDAFSLRELDYGAWRLDATIAPAGQVLTRPSAGEGGDELQALLDQLETSSTRVGTELTVTLPGAVISSNSTRTSGGSATWKLDDPDAPTEIWVETEPTPFLTTAQLVVVGGVAALLVGLLLAAFGTVGRTRMKGRRRRRSARFAGPPPATGGWEPPPGWSPPPSEGSSASGDAGSGGR